MNAVFQLVIFPRLPNRFLFNVLEVFVLHWVILQYQGRRFCSFFDLEGTKWFLDKTLVSGTFFIFALFCGNGALNLPLHVVALPV